MNTDIKNIIYFNKSNNYYIVKDDKEIMVFDLNYDKVYSKDTVNLYSSSWDLVYRRGNIYYEERIKSKKKLTYRYYDIYSGDFVFDIEVGGI